MDEGKVAHEQPLQTTSHCPEPVRCPPHPGDAQLSAAHTIHKSCCSVSQGSGSSRAAKTPGEARTLESLPVLVLRPHQWDPGQFLTGSGYQGGSQAPRLIKDFYLQPRPSP